MALTYKKQDDLEKMLEQFVSLPKIKVKDDNKSDKDKKSQGQDA